MRVVAVGDSGRPVRLHAASVGCTFAPTSALCWHFRALQGISAGVGVIVGRAVIRDLFEGPQAQRLLSL